MRAEFLFDRIAGFFFRYPCVLCDSYPKDNALLCGECTWSPAGQLALRYTGYCAGAAAAMQYTGKAKDAMLRFKREGDRRTERFFVEQMYQTVQEQWPEVTFDLVVPVPMSAVKQLKREFNPAALLARRLARKMDIPLETDALLQKEQMRVQHTLTAEERLQNARQFYASYHPGRVNGRTVLLVDDLITTGATAEICAGLLINAGAKAVYALAAQGAVR